MIVQCAWCKRSLGTTPDRPLAAITHSICQECKRRQKLKLIQIQRTRVKMSTRGMNPGIGSALWRGAKSSYYSYRAERLERRAKRYRERAAGNPSRIPGSALEIRYRRATDGKLYYHPFTSPVRMVANADGSVTLRGGRRIWADDREAGFWERYGHGGRRRRNPMARRRRRRRQDNTMLWLLGGVAALFFWPQISQAIGVGTGPVSTGGQAIIPQGASAVWYSDPYAGGGGEFFVGALPPGASPPWNLASATQIGLMETGLLAGALVQAGGGLVAPNPGFLT